MKSPFYFSVIGMCCAAFGSAAWAGEDHHHGEEHEHHAHEERHIELDEHTAANAGVEISEVQRVTIDEHITLTGRIAQNRNTTVSVPARFFSLVEKVYVTWGQKVKKGDKLATLETRGNLTRYDITAPTDGIIYERNINVGDLTRDDQPLFVMVDLSDVWAELHVFPRDLTKIHEGQQVHVMALESDRETTAPITMILPTADAFSQTVIAVVTLPNENEAWKPGMTIEGDVHLSEEGEAVLAVTKDAIQRMDEQTVVFVQGEEGEFAPRPVVLGKRDDTHVEVVDGLHEGERYVSAGSFIIKADLGKESAGHDHAH